MEALLILANFLAMMFALIWSSRAEKQGEEGGSQGFFAYKEDPKIAEQPRRPSKKRLHR